jgi:hypothetical protein
MLKEKRQVTTQECECDAMEGQLHKFGCRWEYCPFCNLQFIEDCECRYELLEMNRRLHSPAVSHLPQDIYEKEFSPDQEEQWLKMCEAKGRIPYIYSPQLCSRCGIQWPNFFMVQDSVWNYYSGPGLRDKLLCEECFGEIRSAIDRYNARPAWLPSIFEIDDFIKAWRDGDKIKLMELEPEKFKK